jgi:GT2 family glycosyltransferase
MRFPKATIIIVNTNELHHLKRCLPTVLNQKHDDYEIMIIDNASTDGSVEYVEQHFPQVRLINNTANLGYAGANNVGFANASGEVFVVLNPDTKVEPEWLEALIGALRNDPGAGLATSKVLQMDEPDVISGCGLELHSTGLAMARGMRMNRDAFAEVEKVAAVSGAAFAIRRDVCMALGGFDEDFFIYMEDVDLSVRSRLAGYGILYVPQSVLYHDYTLRFGPRKTFYQERNRYLMLLKSLRWGTLLLLLPALLLAELVTWGFVLLREKKHRANKLRAYWWVVVHWKDIMQGRQQVQAFRKVPDGELIAQCTHRLSYEQTGAGPLARLAHLAIDPLFFLFHKLALLLIWW